MDQLPLKIAEAYLQYSEEEQALFHAFRSIVFETGEGYTDELKYGMPFIYYRKKMFCYFWRDKKTQQPYVGFMEGHRINHPLLEKGERTRVKIMPLDLQSDLPINSILEIIQELRASPYYS